MFKPAVANVLDVIFKSGHQNTSADTPNTTGMVHKPPAFCVTPQPTDALWDEDDQPLRN